MLFSENISDQRPFVNNFFHVPVGPYNFFHVPVGVNFATSLPSVGVMECFAFQALDVFFLARDHSLSAARPMMTQMVRARPSAVYTWRRAFFLPRSSSSFARSSGSSV